jgi:hypothetical protein
MNKNFNRLLVIAGILGLAGAGIVSAHGGGWFGRLNNLTPENLVAHYETMFENKAEILGINVDEVKEAWIEGKNLKDIAEEKGISQEEIKEKIKLQKKEHMEERIQVLVDEGIITQEQADKRVSSMLERFENAEFKKGSRRCRCMEAEVEI